MIMLVGKSAIYAARVTEGVPPEPPPGSIVRFSTGMYLYAAVRTEERADLGLGLDGGANWQTTSSNDPAPEDGGGIPKLATWRQILDFTRGRRVEVATMWGMLQEGFPSKVVDWGELAIRPSQLREVVKANCIRRGSGRELREDFREVDRGLWRRHRDARPLTIQFIHSGEVDLTGVENGRLSAS